MKANPLIVPVRRSAVLEPEMRPPNRREFLKRFGTGLMVWAVLGPVAGAEESEAPRPATVRPRQTGDFNSFLHIDESGHVTCFTGKIEMGQGIITSLPVMLAEDLDVSVDDVEIVMGDTELCPFDGGTFGSQSTRQFGLVFRAAAAEARGVLLGLAAAALQVPEARLTVREGVVADSGDPSRRISYGQLTQGKRIERRLTVNPGVKAPGQYKIVGKPMLRRDSRDKVTGKAKYSGDLRLPGMLYARILRVPAHGAKLKTVDASAVREIEGARFVQLPDLVAVLHEFPDIAEEALGKLRAEFEPSPSKLDDKTIYDHLEQAKGEPRVVAHGGDIETGRAQAVRRYDQTYRNPYVAHAAMETHTALANVEGEKATIWASTQTPFPAREEIARTLGLPIANVRVITPPVGGGFGGKSFNLQAVEAARLSKETGRPVQVMWTREEEFFNDTFRPAAVVKIQSGLDKANRIAFWDYEVLFAGDRGAAQLYDIAHHRTSSVGGFQAQPGIHPFAVGAWRAPGSSTNAFARESHIDQLASMAGADPIEFRLSHLKDARLIRVLQAAAEHWGWKAGKGPSGRGLGVACGSDAGSYVAGIAEVEVGTKEGKISVKRVLCVQEMGLVINPSGAKLQMEGCVTMGMGYALTEEIHFKDGALRDTNFDTYALPRFSWLPKIETVLLDADDTPPQGGGEPAIILMGAVLANALYDATGVRMLELPMTPERVKAALVAKA
ncbi:MAG: molybdopterin cofactor-binding domain-containing protein [Opitutaceae bacterium]|jgi:isoquinoline 1-oxidoreductase